MKKIYAQTSKTPPAFVDKGTFDRSGKYWSCRKIDGFDRALNAVIGPREPGKTAYFSYMAWKKCCLQGLTCVYLVRNKNAITDSLAEKIRTDISAFCEVPPFYINSTGSDTGVADIYCEGFPVFRVIALSMARDQLKRVSLLKPSFILFDEFTRDTRAGDRYLTDEAGRFKELYTTIVRKHRGLKAYFIGNIYSLYNPYFLDWGVDTAKLKAGEVYVNDMCAVEMVTLTEELRKEIVRKNPFYEFDDFYARYALDGRAKNDGAIRVVKNHPRNYRLSFLIRTGSRLIGVYRAGTKKSQRDFRYWVGWGVGNENKKAYAYDIKEVIDNTKMAGKMEKFLSFWFKEAMGEHEVAFGDLSCYYLIEEIYSRL